MSLLARLWRRVPDHAQHSILAALAMAVVGGLWWVIGGNHPAVVGALVGVAIFYGREIRDVEIHNAGEPGRPGMDDPAVLLPWRWRYRDSLTDFLWPLATNSALAVLIEIATQGT